MSTKLTDLAALAVPAGGDLLTLVDVDDLSGGAAGTSKKITYDNLTGKLGIQTKKITLDNADVLAMKYNNTPITLKAAEALKIIMPISVICVATYGADPEGSSEDLRMGWDASQSNTLDRWGEGRDWMNGVTSGTITAGLGGASSAGSSQIMTFSITNSPFQIWCTGDFDGGWTMDVYFSYVMLDA
tara:strand:- start:453 stop:1010 length:558 start_codon:yes stop_codon:yes gene_type:complete